MCCFSGAVSSVSATSIFARALGGGHQALVYEMSLAAEGELAMVLPIPVPARSAEDAVSFISLLEYPRFFRDLERAYPKPVPRLAPQSFSFQPAHLALAVHDVGDFDASFVPTAADFDRLDPRFRLPEETLRALGDYADWGFAVFKLKAARVKKPFHPMAFSFPRRDPGRLFLPTLHIHDGTIHPTANFDHSLYVQWANSPSGFEPSAQVAGTVIDERHARGLVEPMALLHRLELRGFLPNQDVWVG